MSSSNAMKISALIVMGLSISLVEMLMAANTAAAQLPPTDCTYFFIKSRLNGLVLDIKGANTSAGTPITTYYQKPSGTDNQLWTFEKDPNGSGYYFIKSRLNGLVIDIVEANTAAGTPITTYYQKPSGTDNQLWMFSCS